MEATYGDDVHSRRRPLPAELERLAPASVAAMNLRCFNPQFYIASRVGDAALDQEMARRAGGFDDQMGIVIDALRVLCAAVPTEGLLPADRLALDRLHALGERANSRASNDGAASAGLTSAEVDDLVERLRRLRRHDPEAADEILRRLVEEAAAPEGTSPG
jgi:hypothetical protein